MPLVLYIVSLAVGLMLAVWYILNPNWTAPGKRGESIALSEIIVALAGIGFILYGGVNLYQIL